MIRCVKVTSWMGLLDLVCNLIDCVHQLFLLSVIKYDICHVFTAEKMREERKIFDDKGYTVQTQKEIGYKYYSIEMASILSVYE